MYVDSFRARYWSLKVPLEDQLCHLHFQDYNIDKALVATPPGYQ